MHRWRPADGRHEHRTLPDYVSALFPTDDAGRLLVATGPGLSFLDEDGLEPWLELPELDLAATRLNDGRCDSAGRIWVGTLARDSRSPLGVLYRVDPDGTVEIVRRGLVNANGIGWSPDDSALYHVDSGARTLERFAFDRGSGSISAGEGLVRIGKRDGLPDGLAVDAEGCLWLGLWGAGRVRRYSADGKLLDEVRAPGAAHTTAPCLGGEELRDLYVTSARVGGGGDGEHAGRLFRLRVEAAGLPEPRFSLRARRTP